jgi:hypothetical protein
LPDQVEPGYGQAEDFLGIHSFILGQKEKGPARLGRRRQALEQMVCC